MEAKVKALLDATSTPVVLTKDLLEGAPGSRKKPKIEGIAEIIWSNCHKLQEMVDGIA
jgi:hypothetical protein